MSEIVSYSDFSERYAILPKYHYTDERLSYNEIGFIDYIIQLPKGWKTSIEKLVKNHANGETSVKTIIKGLKEKGYLEVEKVRDEKGKITGSRYVVYPCPKSMLEELGYKQIKETSELGNISTVKVEKLTEQERLQNEEKQREEEKVQEKSKAKRIEEVDHAFKNFFEEFFTGFECTDTSYKLGKEITRTLAKFVESAKEKSVKQRHKVYTQRDLIENLSCIKMADFRGVLAHIRFDRDIKDKNTYIITSLCNNVRVNQRENDLPSEYKRQTLINRLREVYNIK